MDNTITTLEMCAGYGGIGLGIKNIFGERLRTLAYCELEGFAQANLISKMEKGLLDAAPIWNDLKTFPYESFHGLVDILIAGYPCQPFSAAGKRAGKEDPRHLWPWIADGIRLLQPTMCFFENVEGHISLGLSTVISDLEELGYKVSWGIFSASEVGAPHQRKRVFIMAHNNSERVKEFNGGIAVQSLSTTIGDCCIDAWPSRPGEPQYAWEPPRVLSNSISNRPHNSTDEQIMEGEGIDKLQVEQSRDSEAMGSAEARLEDSNSCGGKEPEYQHTNLPSEPSGGNTEAVGNASQREDLGRESRDLGQEAGEGRCGDDAADGTSEAVGNSSNWRGGESRDEACEGQGLRTARPGWSNEEQRKIECEMGRNAYEPPIGVGISELSGLSHSELAEIREWMVKTDNRTDELRLLGNGVVPATATRAFLTLLEKLTK